MDTSNRRAGAVGFELIAIVAAAIAALIGYVLRTSRKMPEQKTPAQPGTLRISAQELMSMRLPLDRRFAAALERIRREHVPKTALEASSDLSGTKASPKLDR